MKYRNIQMLHMLHMLHRNIQIFQSAAADEKRYSTSDFNQKDHMKHENSIIEYSLKIIYWRFP